MNAWASEWMNEWIKKQQLIASDNYFCIVAKGFRWFNTHLQSVQVCGIVPILVISDTSHSREADGNAPGSVHAGAAELCTRDLPYWSSLQQVMTHEITCILTDWYNIHWLIDGQTHRQMDTLTARWTYWQNNQHIDRHMDTVIHRLTH